MGSWFALARGHSVWELSIADCAISIFVARVGEKARVEVGGWWVCGHGVSVSRCGKKGAAGIGRWWVCDHIALVALRSRAG